MASSSGSGGQLARLVVLPGEDADVIEDLVRTATGTNSQPHSSRPTGGEASEQLRISAGVARQEMESHGSVLEVLTDAVTSEDHVWQFLDVLGRRMSGHMSLEGSLRGLLLLHGFLRTCTPQRERETAQLLLQTHDRSGRPSLDLLHLSKTLLSSSSSSSSSSQADGAATAAARAYAKLLLQRLACARFVPLSASGSTAKQSSQQQQQEGAGNPAAASAASATGMQSGSGLGAQYWAQLGAADLTKQIQALQQLQECVVQSGNACADWVAAVAMARETSGKDAGAAGVMHVVLENLLQDSFVLFSAINYGLMELIDRLGKISKDQALEALQVCRTSAAHGKALSDLYVRLGSLQVGHGVAFPSVEVIGDAYLSSLEQYVDGSTAASRGGTVPGTPHSLSRLPSSRHALPNAMVLFAPSGADTPAPPHTVGPQSLATPANAGPPPPSPVQIAAQLQFEATAQALFGSHYNPRPTSAQQPLLALPAPGQAPSPHPSNAHSATAAGPAPGKAVWELALEASLGSPTGAAAATAGGGGGGGPVSPGFSSSLASSGDVLHPSQSILQMPPLTDFGGGLDQLLLDSLYEAAEAQRAAYKAMAAAAHYQSNPHLWAGSVPPPAVASAGYLPQQGAYAPQQGQGPYPLPQQQLQQHGAADPFAASAACAPPASVQMAMRARQQLAMELERRMMAKHAQFSAYLQQQQQQQQMVPSWGGVGVRYGNVVVPY